MSPVRWQILPLWQDQVVSALHGGSFAVRRHVRPPAVMWETHLFDEVSPGELRDLQTGGGEGVPLW